jgi:DHA2 family multidrug resistance protein-like MFS transporter
MSGGLALAAVGAGILTQLGGASTLSIVMAGFLVFAFGLSLTFTLAVDLVVSCAPPERAGSASALAETGAELGAAAGIAILGSIITFLYRGAMADLPDAPLVARQTLGGAVAAARELPGPLGAELLEAARAAYSHSTSVTAAICAVALVVASIACDRAPGSPRRSRRDVTALVRTAAA